MDRTIPFSTALIVALFWMALRGHLLSDQCWCLCVGVLDFLVLHLYADYFNVCGDPSSGTLDQTLPARGP